MFKVSMENCGYQYMCVCVCVCVCVKKEKGTKFQLCRISSGDLMYSLVLGANCVLYI